MELRYYRNKIEIDGDAKCMSGCGVDETIEHVLCECVATMEARRRLSGDPLTPLMLTTHPEICRSIFATRYGDLRIPAKKTANEQEHSKLIEVNRSVVREPSVDALDAST